METEAYGTPIQNFYAGQTIFITGGTGFLGKSLIEKLLRSCPDISMIYLLIRSKKDKSSESRLNDMFEIPLYDRLKREVPNFRKKVMPITGDFSIENFGLSESDENILINKVSIIFHVAGNVRFQESFKTATTVNVNSIGTILKLAKHMPNLKSLIHVSTAYMNCDVEHVEERLYSNPVNYKQLITFAHNLPENVIKKMLSRFISNWSNIYMFTKRIAEGLVGNECEDLPVGIFRPAMVVCSASEPFPGWIDNKYGPLGFLMFCVLGIARFAKCNGNQKANIVPVDFMTNALIASAWDVFKQGRRGKDMLIYNFVPPINGPTLGEYFLGQIDISKRFPLRNAIYLPLLVLFKRNMPYRICVWLAHFLPALLMDAANICIGRKPRMWKTYMRIDKMSATIQPFITREWSYSTDNVQAMWDHLNEKDQQLFEFNMVGLDWTKYLIEHYKGVRLYLLKENSSTLNIGYIKYKRFYWIHQIIKAAFVFVILWIISIIFGKICNL